MQMTIKKPTAASLNELFLERNDWIACRKDEQWFNRDLDFFIYRIFRWMGQ